MKVFKEIFLVTLLVSMFLSNIEGASKKINVSSDVWISSCEGEENFNMGKADRLKLKFVQEMALLKFDISSLKGYIVEDARLFLHHASNNNKLRKIGVSTVSSDWVEGLSTNYALDEKGNGATFKEASYKKKKWTNYPGSDLTDVTFTNGNTLACYDELKEEGNGWFSVRVEPALIWSLIAEDSYGLCIMDMSPSHENNFVNSKESNFPPYLLVNVSKVDNEPPSLPSDLKIFPSLENASLTKGAIKLTFSVPKDSFCYHISIDKEPVERYLIPHPAKEGEKQEIIIPDLEPKKKIKVTFKVADKAGNFSKELEVDGEVSNVKSCAEQLPEIKLPALSEKTRELARKEGREPELPKYSNKMRVWAFPEVEKVDPISGINYDEKGNYQILNYVWNSETSTIRVAGMKGEIVAFQLCIERIEDSLNGVKINISDLQGPENNIVSTNNISLFKVWYVKDEKWQEELAVPLRMDEEFDIPDLSNIKDGQKNQAIYVDILIPKELKAGTYTGKIRINANGVKEVNLNLSLIVYDLIMPDELNFVVELNSYNSPPAGTKTFFDYHRLAHSHRTTLNTVPYSQTGNVQKDKVPPVEGVGKNQRISDWTNFDKNIGPLLDGSAFNDCPRKNIPVTHIYLPFHEFWPNDFRKYYKFSLPQGVKWLVNGWTPAYEHTLQAPPIEKAFSQEFIDGFISVVKDFAKHLEEKGWNKVKFLFFMNNKYSFGATWWLFDEPYDRDDWLALAYFGKMFKEGIKDIKGVNFVMRADVSRPQWQRDWLDGIYNLMVVSGEFFNKNKLCMIMKEKMPATFWHYGACNEVKLSNLNNEAWAIKVYIYGGDGLLPWNSIGTEGSITKPDQTGILVPGRKFKETVVGSLRLKALRRGQQDVEYLIHLAKKKGYDREQIRDLVLKELNLSSTIKQKFIDEAAQVEFTNLSAEKFGKLREKIALELSK